MPPADPAAFWGMLATGASGLVTALVSFVWMDYRKRTEKLETMMEGKVDKEEMNRQRDNVATLFEKLELHAQRDTEQFKELTSTINKNHMEVMKAVADSGGRRR